MGSRVPRELCTSKFCAATASRPCSCHHRLRQLVSARVTYGIQNPSRVLVWVPLFSVLIPASCCVVSPPCNKSIGLITPSSQSHLRLAVPTPSVCSFPRRKSSLESHSPPNSPMVSPVPNAAKSPPLSYADRVKKSQRNGAANASPAQRPLSQSVTSPVASPRTNGPQGTVFSPSATVSSKSSSEVSKSPQRQPIAPPQAEKSTAPRQTNGEAHPADVEPVAGPSSSTSKKVPAPPGANVWDLRKVHLAAKVAPQSLPQQPGEAYQGLPASKGPTASAPPADIAPPAPSQKNISVTPATKSAPVQERPLARATEEDEDAWVVRPDRAPAAVRLNRLDASSWPEVGKAPVNGVGDVGDAAKEDKGKKDSQGPASRKSESSLTSCHPSLALVQLLQTFCRGAIRFASYSLIVTSNLDSDCDP